MKTRTKLQEGSAALTFNSSIFAPKNNMKKLIVTCSLLLAFLGMFAQPQNYVFTVTNGVPYQNLSAPNVVTTVDWDDFDATIPLGFNFTFLGATTNTLYFYSNDMNTGTDLQFSNSSLTSSPFNGISWLYDLEDRHVYNPSQFSKVGYQTDVVSGKKVTKIEWNNVGFLDDTLHIDSANVQLWLYEDGNALEYRFGNSSRASITAIINDPNIYGFKGPVFAFVKNYNALSTSFDQLYYPSNFNPATMDSADLTDVLSNPGSIGVDSFPKSNTLLRWAIPSPSGLNGVQLNDNITVFPTVIENDLHIRFNTYNNYTLMVLNSNGQMIRQQKLQGMNDTVDMHALAPGNYILAFVNGNEKIVYQVTKK